MQLIVSQPPSATDTPHDGAEQFPDLAGRSYGNKQPMHAERLCKSMFPPGGRAGLSLVFVSGTTDIPLKRPITVRWYGVRL
nr:hypothetical protein [Sphingomonas bacterium]